MGIEIYNTSKLTYILVYLSFYSACSVHVLFVLFYSCVANRFDPHEAITHGVETVNLCEISVDVADVGSDSWSLKTEKDAQAKMSGNTISDFTLYICVVYPQSTVMV